MSRRVALSAVADLNWKSRCLVGLAVRARHGLEAYLRRNGLRHRCSAVGVAASALCLRRHISASRVAQNGKQLSYQYSLVQFGRLTFWCSRQRCISQVSLPTNFRAAACLRAARPPSVSVPPSMPGCKGTGMWSTRPTALPASCLPARCLLAARGRRRRRWELGRIDLNDREWPNSGRVYCVNCGPCMVGALSRAW